MIETLASILIYHLRLKDVWLQTFLVDSHYGISETTMAITQQKKSLEDPCHLLLFLAYEVDKACVSSICRNALYLLVKIYLQIQLQGNYIPHIFLYYHLLLFQCQDKDHQKSMFSRYLQSKVVSSSFVTFIQGNTNSVSSSPTQRQKKAPQEMIPLDLLQFIYHIMVIESRHYYISSQFYILIL